ncbi:hypothetical protein [Dyella silvatica]|uniref:hypothetical protein n=1 Tax=Dyella silvatica TaxID=2992128 RepID=UPI00224DC99E|nr:hypothetical protein [Dyella silvatica]
MDFTKFISLLETNQLYFNRCDHFDDPYEGTVTQGTTHLMCDNGKTEQDIESYIESTKVWRQQMYVNCWCKSEHESAAMWGLYLQTTEGVAIRSTSARLAAVLDPTPISVGLTEVRYVDYERHAYNWGNIFHHYVYKRLSFRHEMEVRAVVWGIEEQNQPLIEANAPHVLIDVDLPTLIESVQISPTAQPWFVDLVKRCVKRYGLDVPVVQSDLYRSPLT